MKIIKVLGTGCAKCNVTFQNVGEAIKCSGIATKKLDTPTLFK
jgi:hypothetical protein